MEVRITKYPEPEIELKSLRCRATECRPFCLNVAWGGGTFKAGEGGVWHGSPAVAMATASVM